MSTPIEGFSSLEDFYNLEQPPSSDAKKSGFFGRVVADWTQATGGLMAGAGLISGIAGLAKDDQTVIIIAAIVGTVGTLQLLLRISCLKPKKELKKQVTYLEGEVQRLTRNQDKLIHLRNLLQQWLEDEQASAQELRKMIQYFIDQTGELGQELTTFETRLFEKLPEQESVRSFSRAKKEAVEEEHQAIGRLAGLKVNISSLRERCFQVQGELNRLFQEITSKELEKKNCYIRQNRAVARVQEVVRSIDNLTEEQRSNEFEIELDSISQSE